MDQLDYKIVRQTAIKVLDSYTNIESTLFKDFRTDVAKAMDIPEQQLKCPDAKSLLKESISEVLENRNNSDSDSCEEPEEKVSRKKKPGTKTARKKSSTKGNKYDSQLQILTRMQRAAGLGPNVFRNLPEDKSARVSELSERLKAAGAKFSGKIPSVKEIADAKKKSDLKKDMEGIDTSNILTNSTRRRRPRYTTELEMSDAVDEEADSDLEFRDTKRVNKGQEEEDDEDTNMESDGEEEFTL